MSPTAITSTATLKSSKKRKHEAQGAATSSSKKIKTSATTATTEAVTAKKKKKSKKHHELGEEFKRVRVSMSVSLPPIFTQDPTQGIEEMLDSLILRFVPCLHGVVLAHSHLQLSSEKAVIQFDCPYATCHTTFEALVWSPAIGMRLTARVKLSSTDHIGLLAHDIFNVSIPKHHIPLSEFVFQHGPAESDPEFGWGTADNADGDTDMAQTSAAADTNAAIGTWVRIDGSEPLGGDSGHVEFTVVGLRAANNTLTLIGSLQTDPFSPSHVPEATLSGPSSSYVSPNKRRRVVAFGDSEGTVWGESDPQYMQDTTWSSGTANQPSSPTLPSTEPVPSDSEDDVGERFQVTSIIMKKRGKAAAREEEPTTEQELDTWARKEKKKKPKTEVGSETKGEDEDPITETKRKKKKKKQKAD